MDSPRRAGRRRRLRARSAALGGARGGALRAGWRRAQGRFWTGPLAHLLGGGMDLLGAIVGYQLERARRGAAPPRD